MFERLRWWWSSLPHSWLGFQSGDLPLGHLGGYLGFIADDVGPVQHQTTGLNGTRSSSEPNRSRRRASAGSTSSSSRRRATSFTAGALPPWDGQTVPPAIAQRLHGSPDRDDRAVQIGDQRRITQHLVVGCRVGGSQRLGLFHIQNVTGRLKKHEMLITLIGRNRLRILQTRNDNGHQPRRSHSHIHATNVRRR